MGKKSHGSKKKHPFYRFKKHTNKHHVYPASRFILKKKPILHTAWHDVFENSTPEEAAEKVKMWKSLPKEYEEEILNDERKLRAWKLLFAEAELNTVIAIIQKEWIFPGVKMIKTN